MSHTCTACGRVFGGLTNFDRHRTGEWDDRQCVDPVELDLEVRERKSGPVWVSPDPRTHGDDA